MSGSAQAEPEEHGPGFWRYDRIEHASGSAVMASATYVFLRKKKLTRWQALATSLAATFIFAASKEIFDTMVDLDDVRADIVGCTAGGGIAFSIDVMTF